MNLDEQIVLMCAMRYSLGRMTYVVSAVTDELIKNWNEFDKSNQKVILAEIKRAIELGKAGMDMDVKRWTDVINNTKSSGGEQ